MTRPCPCCDEEMDADAAECGVCGYITESAPAPADAALAPGAVVDKKYRLVKRLGEGGMGEVWRVEHTLLKKDYALKLLGAAYCADAKFREKFLGEGRVLTELRHQKIVEAHDVGITEASRLYLTMELVEGETLREIVKREKVFSIDDALWIARELLAVLIYAHDKGVVHRDLKPENLVVQGWGTDQRRLKILDFGIAKMVAEGMPSTTSANTLAGWGTIQYMSPEQMIGDPVDARTDLYAVGVILYELLAGRRPLEAESGQKLAAKLLADEPEALRRIRVDVPPGVESVVMAALSKQREKRPESAGKMLAALDARTAPAPPKRRPIFAVLVGAALVVGAIFAAAWPRPEPPRPPPVVVVVPDDEPPAPPPAEVDPDPPIAGATRTELAIRAFCVALSPDGATLAGGLDAGKIALWSDGETRHIEAGAHFVQAVAFSPDGRRLAAGYGDGVIRVWDAPFEGAPRELTGHDHVVRALAFGAALASASADGTVRLWDPASGECTATFSDPGGFVEAVAVDGATVASGGVDARVRLWSTGATVRVFAGHTDAVHAVAFAGRLVSGGGDRTLRFWDVATGDPARKPIELPDPVYALAVSPKGRHLAVATGRRIAVYSTETWEPVHEFAAASPPYAVAWAPGRVAACGDGPVEVWDFH